MPGVSRVGVDTAAGTITGPGASSVFANGSKVSLIGDVFAEGTGVVRAGDAASCGHTATGSSDTFAN